MASEGPVVLSYHDTLLRQSDVALLQPGQWLNDNLIAFWFDYLEHELYADVGKDLALIGPQVSQFIKSAAQTTALVPDVLSMLTAMDLDSKRLVITPINDQDPASTKITGTHWSLLTFNKDSKSFEHYDSFSGSVNHFHAEQIANIIKPLLTIEQPHVELNVTEMPCTQQKNSFDCGIHLVINAEAACRRTFRSPKQMVLDIATMAEIKQGRNQLSALINRLKQ